ncbi:hypothetical protein VKT23_014161 [Stygiomarasmius scandens]|uniref:Uncharacterized protein n=1 Tax=Marasmiellus scandens TaxID=2682957 RepID=A0ABR1J1T4_9AGAR
MSIASENQYHFSLLPFANSDFDSTSMPPVDTPARRCRIPHVVPTRWSSNQQILELIMNEGSKHQAFAQIQLQNTCVNHSEVVYNALRGWFALPAEGPTF